MADFRDTRDSVARRVMARSSGAGPVGERGIGDGSLDRWQGGGGYFYEITDEGIKVTGGPESKTLQGKSIVLPWEGRDPKNLAMIDAILQERGETHTKLGAAPAPEPEPTPDLEAAEPIAPTVGELNAPLTKAGVKEAFPDHWESQQPEGPPPTSEQMAGPGDAERARAEIGKYGESTVPYEERRMQVIRAAMKAKDPSFVGPEQDLPYEDDPSFSDPGPSAEELGAAGESPDVVYQPPESHAAGGFEIPTQELEQMSDEELERLGFKGGKRIKVYDTGEVDAALNRRR